MALCSPYVSETNLVCASLCCIREQALRITGESKEPCSIKFDGLRQSAKAEIKTIWKSAIAVGHFNLNSFDHELQL